MKPLLSLKVYIREPMDPDTLVPLGCLDFPTAGDGKLVLTRDEVGAVRIEAVDVTQNPELTEMLEHATKSLEALHSKMGETSIASQHALTDMFAVHKWLTR